MTDIPESLLAKQLQNGDEDAFKFTVDKFKTMVYNVCLNFIHIAEDAEELTQDVFVEVYRSIKNFRSDASLKTWIYRIAISKCLEFNRKLKRKKRFGFMFSIGNVPEAEFESNMVHPGVLFENQEKAEMMFSEIKKLSENQQIAFNLCHIEGMSYKEITEIMDVSLPSVESLIFRAKRNLRKKLTHIYNKKD